MEAGRIPFSYTSQEIFIVLMANSFTYHPGVCNIDQRGVVIRRRLAYATIIGGVVAYIVFYLLGVAPIFRAIAEAGFGFGVALNLYQAKEQFCVINASMRTTEADLVKTKIVDDLYKKLDLKKRNAMLLKAMAFAIMIGAVAYLLP